MRGFFLMSRFFKSAAFPILIVVVLAFFAQKLIGSSSHQQKQTFGNLLAELDTGQVKSMSLHTKDNTVDVTLLTGQKYTTGFPDGYASQLIDQGKKDIPGGGAGLDVQGKQSNGWLSLLTYILPFVIFLGFWIFLMNQVQGGGSKVMSFGKSRAKRMSVDSPKITFRDVAGVDEAVEELHEIKEFLENPKKFQALGARIPKGVLLYGPPGTGKTLLARAVAGEAGVPFFSISGSDFVEMFVGVGASRVRDLFEQAKQAAPCIVFMDEIHAVGRHRGARLRGAPRQEDHRAGRGRGRDHARHRRPGKEGAPPLGARAQDHRVPRDGPRARRPLSRAHRSDPQDHDRVARPGARPHHLASDGGPLSDDAHRAHAPDGHDARWTRRGGDRLPRGDDRRRERSREGHVDG